MKRFKYKLDTVLKLRDFEKKKIELELGRLNKNIKNIEDLIKEIHTQLKLTQQEVNRSGKGKRLDISLIKYFPQFLKAKSQELENEEEKLSSLLKERDIIIENLNVATGKVKVLEKDKEKKRLNFLKDQMKKDESSREDLRNIFKGSA